MMAFGVVWVVWVELFINLWYDVRKRVTTNVVYPKEIVKTENEQTSSTRKCTVNYCEMKFPIKSGMNIIQNFYELSLSLAHMSEFKDTLWYQKATRNTKVLETSNNTIF